MKKNLKSTSDKSNKLNFANIVFNIPPVPNLRKWMIY